MNAITFLIIGVLVAFAVLGLIVSRLYTRASKERAFIRTGLGGQKVVLSGGAIVLPIFHEIIWVNLCTLNLPVHQEKEKSLTTKDRLRVDTVVNFYVRVANNADAIANAAQTLGQRTLKPDELKALIEGKFVDALRAVATQMTMTDLQDKRAEFVQHVQLAVTEDLKKNGLELESASLTRLEQTRTEFYDENNVFDAEGLTAITRETSARRKTRNEIARDTDVAMQQKDMTANQESLSIALQREQATLENAQQTARMRAEQEAEVARTAAAGKQASETAQITAEQAVATARIVAEQALAEREAERLKTVEKANIATKTAIEIAEQDQAIAVADKSRQQSEAKATAEEARAKAVVAEEQVVTARATAQAEREKAVQVISAQAKAEQDSVGVVVKAQAEQRAVVLQAEAEQQAAAARAEALRIAAQGESDAAKARAEGTIAEGEAVAQALRVKNDAQNTLSEKVMDLMVRQQTIAALPEMMAVMVRSVEKIESIKIVELSGANGVINGGNAGAGNGGNGSLADQVVNGAMRHRAFGSMMDGLMGELGLNPQNLNTLLNSATTLGGVATPAVAAPAEETTAAASE
jgi:uncharacterized membrane protein YqiK